MKVRKSAHKRPAWFGSHITIANPTVNPIGPETIATIVIDPLSGSSVGYEWVTDIHKAWSGKERRHSVMAYPRQTYKFKALMEDDFTRRALSMLAQSAPDAEPFLLGLMHESLSIVGATSATATVNSLSLCDWATPGQRVVVMGPDGEIDVTHIAFTSSNVITLNDDVTGVSGLRGSRIMPSVAVHLAPEQKLGRHAVNAEEWELVGHAIDLFYGDGTRAIGTGATVNTYDGLPVWDQGVDVKATVGQPMFSGADLVDLGQSISAFARPGGIADWGREIRISSDSYAGWQYLKKFLHTVRGRQVSFLLPTYRPDLVPVGDASSGSLVVEGPPTENAPDYTNAWFPSLGHRRLRLLKADGSTAYVTVTGAADNFDGTQTLTLAAGSSGALSRVELLETCRFDSDEIEVEWTGHQFRCVLPVKVVQQ